MVLRALALAKDDRSIDAVVTSLDQAAADALMKYLCRALSSPSNQQPAAPSQTQLFKWHASVVRTHGLGCVVRALSDKQMA